jgi:hypothetical protein
VAAPIAPGGRFSAGTRLDDEGVPAPRAGMVERPKVALSGE